MKMDSADTERVVSFDDDDDDDHSYAVSSFAGSDGESVGTDKEEYTKTPEEQEEIAKSETTAVFWLKLTVMLVMILSAVVVALSVYFYTSVSEQDEFEAQFTSDSVKVLESVGLTLETTFGAADAFVLKLVDYARYSNSSWPYVSLPNHAVHAAKLLSLSKAFYMSQNHLVSEEQRALWELYSVANDAWVYEAIEVEKKAARFDGLLDGPILTSPNVYDYSEIRPQGLGPYLPQWQIFPVLPNPNDFVYNFDGFSFELVAMGQRQAMSEKRVVVSHFANLPDLDDPLQVAEAANTAAWGKRFFSDPEDHHTEPMSAVYYPIIDAVDSIQIDLHEEHDVVGVLTFILYWRELINNILPVNSNGVIVVVENACDQVFTYQLNGPDTVFLGPGDQHDPKYDYLGRTSSLFELMDGSKVGQTSSYTGVPVTEEFCPKTLSVYPSQEMQDDHVTSEPILLTVAVVLIFVFTSMVFFLYDWLVERRQKKVMKTAVQSSAIVSSLFPSQVRDRLFPMDDAKADADKGNTPKGFRVRNNVAKAASSPVADLYPESTVMFADIAGFTAWSSVREPKQVFTLLETLYGAFDSIADRRGVFKVETIGDSYVAVVGLPEPRKDHAVVMARFARDCRNDMNRLTRELEITLGPNTNDLQLRFGLHSGPVTAGVLRGQKSRFQLFGDTVNTAARMESNGIRNRIQVSQTTADILIAAGKEHWVTKRDELVSAKGKGKMQTYWVDPKSAGGSVPPSIPQPNESIKGLSIIDDKKQRLVNWNSEVLGRLMRQIVAKRNASSKVTTFEASSMGISSATILPVGATVLDEVKDFIELPEFDAAVVRNQEEPESIEMNDVVPSQLREYVFTVATMYHENLFHNFEHASHVAMSVVKLLSCTFTPEGDAFSGSQQKIASSCHDNTYGIMSDPLTQFACVFSALIHDVDHTGVPNTQLVKENHHIAAAYKGKSVAEQNSFDLAWNTFMDERFNELRNTLCATEEELGRFRQLVVNSVMATDIMDNELKTLRNARWDKAFLEAPQTLGSDRDTVNRKATIVIEHLMQASDIAHTMQHFDIYQKWNELLFAEMYEAYDTGRADKDPSELWYLGELEFFDFCIIPLATKIRECGAFGVTGDEYLACAIKNRQEWEVEGEDVVASMLEKYKGNRAVEQGSL